MPTTTLAATWRPFARALAVAALVSTLPACFPVIATGLAVGTLSAIDRRTTGAQTEDTAIELKATQRLRERLGDKASVSIVSYNRNVLAVGQVASEAAKAELVATLTNVDAVRKVVDETQVGPATGFRTTSSDTLLTAKVKSAMLEARDVQAHAVKVITENDVVYLMGVVNAREAQRAAEVAAHVNGVSRVVRVFEVVSDDELARIERRAAK